MGGLITCDGQNIVRSTFHDLCGEEDIDEVMLPCPMMTRIADLGEDFQEVMR